MHFSRSRSALVAGLPQNLVTLHGVQIREIPNFVFFRVRSNGQVPLVDRQLPGYTGAGKELAEKEKEYGSNSTR